MQRPATIAGVKNVVSAIAAAAVLSLALAAPALAQGAPTAGAPGDEALRAPLPHPEQARLTVAVNGKNGGKVHVGKGVVATIRLFPFIRHQNVRVELERNGKTVFRAKRRPIQVGNTEIGKFKVPSRKLIKPGEYRFRTLHVANDRMGAARAKSASWVIEYPDLDPGDSGPDVKLFNKLLDKRAYYTAHGSNYGDATGRAVLAFRKVNEMSRITDATSGIFKTLAAGKGGFKLRWPEGGKHIEADLSRQVMVLAKNGKAKHIFHISSGTAATPTILGKYPAYLKTPGTNAKGMIDSVYFIRGYATHGYSSVPIYPASHGCLRNPPPDSRFIYDWIEIGNVFYTYP